jgi:N-acetyl sugar amidotransferase
MRYCTRCVLPSVAPTPATFDEYGVCSACRVASRIGEIDWDKRAELFRDLLNEYRSSDGSNYDCIVPVSGGKDSYFQVHLVTAVYGLKPLLVTYHGNNYLPVGEENLYRMREVFDVDHIIVRPSVELLKKINRLCFRKMGDMNWHAHCGIFTVPIQVAVRYRVPLIVWGEHGFMDLGGMFSYSDFVEFTAKTRLEHALRGFDWYDMVDAEEGIAAQDLLWAKYPGDDEIDEVGARGVYVSNFHRWEANAHAELMMDLYGWKPSPEPFDRTYRRISNLDDMHENGAHDYLKYVKFGYGRATDHACKDIRAGLMSRDEGIEMVRRHDHVKPGDLARWLDYVDLSEEEFDRVADGFRDPRVWRRDASGGWVKDNLWD